MTKIHEYVFDDPKVDTQYYVGIITSHYRCLLPYATLVTEGESNVSIQTRQIAYQRCLSSTQRMLVPINNPQTPPRIQEDTSRTPERRLLSIQ